MVGSGDLLKIGSKEVQDFAELICGDKNPIHNINSLQLTGYSQVVPGDYLVALYLCRLKSQLSGVYKFKFKEFISPDSEFFISEGGIFLKESGAQIMECINSQSMTTLADIEGKKLKEDLSNERRKFLSYFGDINPDFQKYNFAHHYCMTTKDIASELESILGSYGFRFVVSSGSSDVVPSKIFYAGASVKIDSSFNGSLNRYILDAKGRISGDGAGSLRLQFLLEEKGSNKAVGRLEKTIFVENLESLN